MRLPRGRSQRMGFVREQVCGGVSELWVCLHRLGVRIASFRGPEVVYNALLYYNAPAIYSVQETYMLLRNDRIILVGWSG